MPGGWFVIRIWGVWSTAVYRKRGTSTPNQTKRPFQTLSGVTFKSKRLTPDEMSAMVDRLCTVKQSGSELGRPHVSVFVPQTPGVGFHWW